MSENKFTEHMEVEKIGTLKPGDIGWGTCDGCEKNIYKFPGVLIQGITEEAAKLLYEKVEIVPEGTKARMEKLEARNREMLEELEKQRNKHCFASSGVGNCDTCRDKQNCSLLRVINKAKGVQG
jgi:hypothetical protein